MHFALPLLLLLTPAGPGDPFRVSLDVESGNRTLGTLDPCPASDMPADWVAVGPLLDGDKPFRAGIDLAFDKLLLRPLSGTVGIGFSPTLHISPELLAGAEGFGSNGTVAFDGVLRVGVFGGDGELLPIVWSRGYDDREASSAYLGATHHTMPLLHRGRRGPYRWELSGTVTVDAHLWGVPSP